MNPIAIIAAPNGARKQKSDHPRLPITIPEIVQDAIECRDAGAAMIHVHARDQIGNHSLAIDDNQHLLDSLSSALGDSIIIQLTTEAIGVYSPEQQMTLVREVKPNSASFALRELMPDGDINQLRQAARFFDWVASEKMLAQYILYDRHDVERYLSLCEQGIIPEFGRHVLLVLGRYTANQIAHPNDLIETVGDSALTAQRWGVCAFGPYEYQCLTTAMLLGADARVGFENNLLDIHGQAALSNASQVSDLVTQANNLKVPILDAHAYRRQIVGV